MKTVAIIPARWQSTRFPGKPLSPILGRPMIEHVYQRALKISGIDKVVVATDSHLIEKAVLDFGGSVVMTASHHPSGTDRLAEAIDIMGLSDDDLVINVQGDQPAFNPQNIKALIESLQNNPSLEMGTLATVMVDPKDVENPNHVKVVFGQNNLALYFSRAPIPWPRDGAPTGMEYYKHIGIYAYRAAFLRRFVKIPCGRLEQIE
ncbi:MAG: 3-deoxy-manno-octulosonate cytidylyltransferase, partial [Candidatus Adiutrix sp.]